MDGIHPDLRAYFNKWLLFVIFIYLGFLSITLYQLHSQGLLLYGNKTAAALDLWSIQHFLWGIALGKMLDRLIKSEYQKMFLGRWVIIIFALAYSWEALEWYLELGGGGRLIAGWLGGLEQRDNRLILDPLLVAIGSLIYLKFRRTFWPAVTIIAIWTVINLLMPNCMSIQEIIFSP